MDAYIYAAALYCEDCGRSIRERLTAEGKAPVNPDDEYTYNSDSFPKGPYPDGGGESDSPEHCAAMDDCINAVDTKSRWGKVGVMLENPLTLDGIDYVRDSIEDRPENPVTKMWANEYVDRYGIKFTDEE